MEARTGRQTRSDRQRAWRRSGPGAQPSVETPWLAVLVLVAGLALVCSLTVAPIAAAGDGCWHPPVAAPVSDPFRGPACRWCPGNRGIEYATDAGALVRAVAAGTVTFAGRVAGTLFVVVRHADGRRATYANLSDHGLDEGDVVVAGAVLGHTAGRFHFGLRDGERYIDPQPMIGQWRGVTRLVPSDGSEPAPAPAPRLVCPASTRPRGGFARSAG